MKPSFFEQYKNHIQDFFEKAGFIIVGISENNDVLSHTTLINIDLGEDGKHWIGKDGLVLRDAVHILNLYLQDKVNINEEEFRYILDINNYSLEDISSYQQDIEKAAQRVLTFERPFHLPPSTSFKRMIAHDYVAKNFTSTLKTISEGFGRDRHIVIRPI